MCEMPRKNNKADREVTRPVPSAVKERQFSLEHHLEVRADTDEMEKSEEG